jgi:hypothetical protein
MRPTAVSRVIGFLGRLHNESMVTGLVFNFFTHAPRLGLDQQNGNLKGCSVPSDCKSVVTLPTPATIETRSCANCPWHQGRSTSDKRSRARSFESELGISRYKTGHFQN